MVTYMNFFIYIFFNFLTGLLFPMYFTPKKKMPYVFYAFIYFLLLLIPSVVKFFSVPYSIVFSSIYYLAILGTLLFIIFLFSDSVWKKILFVSVMLSAFIAGEGISSYMFSKLGLEITLDFSTIECTLLMLSAQLCSMFFLLCFVVIWNRLIRKEIILGKETVGILLLPFSLLMHISYIATIDAEGISGLNFWGMLIVIAGVCLEAIVLFIILINFQKQERLADLNRLKDVMEENQMKYEMIELKIDTMSKEKHDQNNQMVIIRDLVEKEDKEGLEIFICSLIKCLD